MLPRWRGPLGFRVVCLQRRARRETGTGEKGLGSRYTEIVNNNYLAYNKYKDDVTQLEEAVKSPNDDLRQFIDELERKMPAEVAILSANCSRTASA